METKDATGQRDEDVLDLDQALVFLKTTKPTMYRWIAQGRVRGFKAGRQWRFYRRDLRKFLEYQDPAAALVDPVAVQQTLDQLRARAENAGRSLLADAAADAAQNPEEVVLAQLADAVIETAIQERASDIHIDAAPDMARLRLRIDGFMQDVVDIPKNVHTALMGRIKSMAEMNPAEQKTIQYGRILRIEGHDDTELRVTVVPTPYGEKTTLRLLRTSDVQMSLADVGLRPREIERLQRHIKAPNGLVVFAGALGSGKTTVMLSALQLGINAHDVVITVEDPVEYHLAGVTQISINRRAGIDYPEAITAVMRSDPDLVMVGEVTTPETLDGCLKMALTGHLVLSSLYADDASKAVSRLLDMGVPPYTLAAGLRALSCQRLVRVACRHCSAKADYPADKVDAWRRRAEADGLEWPAGAELPGSRGCDKCGGTGYSGGRTTIWEMIEVDDAVRRLIADRRSSEEIRAAAIKGGMTTMFADGVAKVLEGRTTMEEVLRVMGE